MQATQQKVSCPDLYVQEEQVANGHWYFIACFGPTAAWTTIVAQYDVAKVDLHARLCKQVRKPLDSVIVDKNGAQW